MLTFGFRYYDFQVGPLSSYCALGWHFFHTEDGARMWKFVVNRCIVVEKELFEQTQDNIEIMDLLVKAIWLEQYYIESWSLLSSVSLGIHC